VAVVAQAVLGMGRALAPDRPRATLAVAATIVTLAVPSAWGQIGAILLGGLAGVTLLERKPQTDQIALPLRVSRSTGAALLVVFLALLIGLPILASVSSAQALREFDAFYRAGSLVFGGGHVVLPLLQAAVVPPPAGVPIVTPAPPGVQSTQPPAPTQATAPPLAAAQRDSLAYLAAVLRSHVQPDGDLSSLETNVVVMQILDAALRSAQSGKTIALTPLPE